MNEQVLSLKWNNHQTSFTNNVAFIYNKEKYADVTIACEENFYPAHKLVLSACSEYFDKMFSQIEGKNSIIVLKDISRKNIEYLLKYMYLGEVNVDQTDLPNLMSAAECLRIKGLANDAEEENHRKRKLSVETVCSKRREVEIIQSNKKYIDLPDNGRPFTPVIEAGSIMQGTEVSDPALESKSQDKLKRIKEEAVMTETFASDYYGDSSAPNISTSNTGIFIDEESGVITESPHDMDIQEEYKEFQMEPSEPVASDEADSDIIVEHPENPTLHRIYSCMLCNYRTTQKSNLTAHKLVHRAEQPFSCLFCNYKSRRKGNLKRHMHRHEQDIL